MDLKQFQEGVRQMVDHDDYSEHSDLLELIPRENWPDYLATLGAGYKMQPSFAGLSKAIELANHFNLAVSDILRLLRDFQYLEKVLKGNQDVSDPVAEVMDVIDNSTSYQELSFLREHIEFRIATYLKALEPDSMAFSKSWLKKRCPACGRENHIFNTACQTCGWQAS